MGITISHYKDPYITTSIVETKSFFFLNWHWVFFGFQQEKPDPNGPVDDFGVLYTKG